MRVAKTHSKQQRAFTILEVMIALFIFAIILSAIYTTWMGIVKGIKSGTKAAADVQRSRMALRSIHDALLTAVVYNENVKWYYFVADTKGDFAALTFVSRLPASYPGVGHFGDSIVRRVSFYTQSGSDGKAELVMSQVPMLLNTNDGGAQGYSMVLARDVGKFELSFFDPQKKDWVTDWQNTNTLPSQVQVTLALGGSGSSSSRKPEDVVIDIVSMPAQVVAGVQAAGPVVNPMVPPRQ
jgi:prepilin-type N-terminal cleavage/methylation domain-containing protein